MLRSLFTVTATVALAAAVLTAPAAGAADVDKDKDEKGNTLYTDKPATLPAERLNVQTQKTDTVAAKQRADADMARMQGSQQTRQQNNAQRSEEQAANQLTAKDKAERCVRARERYDLYMNSQKLYETQADGERRYLSGEELESARATAKTAMDSMCQ